MLERKGWGVIRVTLKGMTPLLMNRLSPENLMAKSRRKLDSSLTDFAKQAEESAYIDVIDGKRQLYVPAYSIFAMILNTAKQYRVRNTPLSQLLAGTIRIEPEKIPLGTDKYEVDIRPVVIQKNRVLRARAKVPDWEITFNIIYSKNFLPEGFHETLKTILEDAGVRIGLLDYRPQHMGWFGTFTVKEYKILE
ncbi:MAG: hypothetical protein QXT26_06005 [Thermoproteota archaeon]